MLPTPKNVRGSAGVAETLLRRVNQTSRRTCKPKGKKVMRSILILAALAIATPAAAQWCQPCQPAPQQIRVPVVSYQQATLQSYQGYPVWRFRPRLFERAIQYAPVYRVQPQQQQPQQLPAPRQPMYRQSYEGPTAPQWQARQ